MDKKTQLELTRNFMGAMATHVLAHAPHFPEHWDGHDIREFIADEFTSEKSEAMRGTRLRQYRKDRSQLEQLFIRTSPADGAVRVVTTTEHDTVLFLGREFVFGASGEEGKGVHSAVKEVGQAFAVVLGRKLMEHHVNVDDLDEIPDWGELPTLAGF